MSPSLPLDAVCFDLDDTLHDATATYQRAARRAAEEVCATLRVDVGVVTTAFVRASERFWREMTSEALALGMNAWRERRWSIALAAVGIDDADLVRRCATLYHRYDREGLVLWPETVWLLTELRRRGSRLGVITNGFAETHRDRVTQLGLFELVDDVVIAGEVGMLKPDPRLFRLACERLGVTPARATMVGDRYARDVVGAHAAGMATVWLNVHDEHRPADGPPPTVTVERLGDVARALGLAGAADGD